MRYYKGFPFHTCREEENKFRELPFQLNIWYKIMDSLMCSYLAGALKYERVLKDVFPEASTILHYYSETRQSVETVVVIFLEDVVEE